MKVMDKLTELSKEISYALRHAPWEYELEMDEEGWVPVEQLLDALHKEEKWRNISENDLVIMIQKSEKKRHEIFSGKIKAHYGHSIPMKIAKEEKVPPEVLYHGTARRFLNSIREKGLLPKGRQYVHLSQDVETAHSVGMRHAQYFGKKLEKEAKYQWELSEYLNRDICQPEGFDAYGYPSELFKLDMERLGIATKRKPAKVIDIAQYIENNRGTND